MLLELYLIWENLQKARDPLTKGDLDNLDNGFSNKYEKNLKIEKNYKYVLLFID
jgi:hypothetical protein